MKKAEKASTKFILSGAAWYICQPMIWITYVLCQLIVFSFIVHRVEDDNGIFTSLLCFGGILCSITLVCSSDAFAVNYSAIKTMPVTTKSAVKACIDKAMKLYLVPYIFIIPLKIVMTFEYGAAKILTSFCLTADVLAVTGAVYCLSYIMRTSSKVNINHGAYAAVYVTVYLLNGIKALLDKAIFMSQGSVLDLVFAAISALVSILLFLKVRDYVAENYQ